MKNMIQHLKRLHKQGELDVSQVDWDKLFPTEQYLTMNQRELKKAHSFVWRAIESGHCPAGLQWVLDLAADKGIAFFHAFYLQALADCGDIKEWLDNNPTLAIFNLHDWGVLVQEYFPAETYFMHIHPVLKAVLKGLVSFEEQQSFISLLQSVKSQSSDKGFVVWMLMVKHLGAKNVNDNYHIMRKVKNTLLAEMVYPERLAAKQNHIKLGCIIQKTAQFALYLDDNNHRRWDIQDILDSFLESGAGVDDIKVIHDRMRQVFEQGVSNVVLEKIRLESDESCYPLISPILSVLGEEGFWVRFFDSIGKKYLKNKVVLEVIGEMNNPEDINTFLNLCELDHNPPRNDFWDIDWINA